MRYAIAAFVAFLLLVSFMVPSGDAVGIKWSTEKVMVDEMTPNCITYGVYNPSSEDATLKLSVSKELEPVVQGAVSHTKVVKAGTTHDKAVMLDLCFQVPKVYKADCLAGDFLCEQTCTQKEVSYTGEVMAVEAGGNTGGGMGSATTVGTSVPLTLRVRCNPYSRDWTPVYVVVMVVAAAGIAGRVYTKRKKRNK